jgi:hypothetical protein
VAEVILAAAECLDVQRKSSNRFYQVLYRSDEKGRDQSAITVLVIQRL